MTDPIKRLLRLFVTKGLLLDLEDRERAESRKAHEMIRDHSGLQTKRAREAEGQARFRMMEQGFEEVCALHGGHLLGGSLIPHTELKVFQPFMRFEVEGRGVILGLAAMPEPKTIPAKNKSRSAGVSLNYVLTPRFDFDGKGPKIGDVFALLLVARDRERPGQIAEIALGVVNSEYETFLYYESLDGFLTGYGDAPPEPTAPTTSGSGGAAAPAAVTLKKVVKPFVPPETPARENKDRTGEK